MFESLEESYTPEEIEPIRQLLAWARSNAMRLSFGVGYAASVWIWAVEGEFNSGFVSVQLGEGGIIIEFHRFFKAPPFIDEAHQSEFFDRLNAFHGSTVDLETRGWSYLIPLSELTMVARWEEFERLLDWIASTIRQFHKAQIAAD